MASNIDGFKACLKQHPNGEHAQAAADNIFERERSYSRSLLPSNKTPDELRTFCPNTRPDPRPDKARIELHSLTAYRAEFATARGKLLADQRRQEVARRLKKAAPELVVLDPDSQSDRYRLTSAPMSERQVNQLCERAAEVSQACWIVRVTS